jgi:hypothetical protein
VNPGTALKFRDLLENVHQFIDITFGLFVWIGSVFFPPAHPDLEIKGIRLLNLINQPVLDLQDKQSVLVLEKNKIRFLPLFLYRRLVPADKIRIRPGRFPKERKTDFSPGVAFSRVSISSGYRRAIKCPFT